LWANPGISIPAEEIAENQREMWQPLKGRHLMPGYQSMGSGFSALGARAPSIKPRPISADSLWERVVRSLSIVLLAAGAAQASAGASLPVFFVANRGQAPRAVRYMAQGSGLTAYFLSREILLRTQGMPVHMRFEGAGAARVEGVDPLPGRANFLTGGARQWHRDIPMFGAVRYRDLYPGIDMVYGGSGLRLKSEFVVAPGADPARIRVRYAGAGPPTVQPDGSIAIPMGAARLVEGAPYIYQQRNGAPAAVEGRYTLYADGSVGFVLGAYDRSRPLIIDPVLSFSTLVGGSSGFTAATAIAVDAAGAAYIAGYTDSYTLPAGNPAQNFNAGGTDAFVAKLNPSGNGLAYCTYLGGSGDDRAYAIAVDSTGAAYVAGTTTSPNFPTRNAEQSHLAGARNAFVFKLNPAGDLPVFSTYLGGNGSDTANGIAIDASGNSYVVGDTTSMNFPAGAFQTSYHGSQDAFVSKLSSDGGHLLFSTYLGGAGTDHGAAVAVGSTGDVYVAGSTWSFDFPVANAFQRSIGGLCDAFVAHLSSNGNTLLFSTYLGGSGGSVAYPETAQGIALDAAGDAYVVGVTSSADFPLRNAIQPALLGFTDAFVAKLNSSGSLMYSTYMGGSGVEVANSVAVDGSGAAYVVGYTYSTDFPVTTGALQVAIGGGCDAFLFKLSPAGDALQYATYFGGSGQDTASGVALDASGNIYLAGWTLSADFPVKPGT
jgi:hypothetical protein